MNNYHNILVTVVITTFKRLESVKQALESVMHQTYKNLEVIVVEDGSDSGIEDWIKQTEYAIQYVRHDHNRGLATARNTGLKLSKADYIAYLDDDDEWKPERIEKQIEILNKLPGEAVKRLGVIYCGTEIRVTGTARVHTGHPKNHGPLRESILRAGAITLPSTCLFSKKALREVGGFDEKLPSSIDHDIWMKLAANDYEAFALDLPLVIVRTEFKKKRMTNDTLTRIEGVKMFVEKWQPTFQEWLGKEKGAAYSRRYFTRAISGLALNSLWGGRIRDFAQALKSMFGFNPEIGYTILTLAKGFALNFMVLFLPPVIYEKLLHFKRRLNN